MSNSNLVNYTKISPNSNPRDNTIKKMKKPLDFLGYIL